MPITTRNGFLEEWYNKMYMLRCAFSGETPLSPIPLPDVTTIDGLLEGIADEADSSLIALAKSAGIYHDYDDAYALQLPAKLYRWYGVKKIGGNTVVMNQLVQNGNFADGTTGWTATRTNMNVVDGALVLTGTGGSSYARGARTSVNFVAGHIYYVSAVVRRDTTVSAAAFNSITVRETDGESGHIFATISTPTAGKVVPYNGIFTSTIATATHMYFATGASASVATDAPMFSILKAECFDLTLMFGSGNEPTLDQCKEMFPADYYPYNAGTLLSAGVTEVVSTDSTDTEIDTLAIPNEVQSLAGYGLSCPGAYNYIDFETKKFVQNVGFVDLSTLAFGYGPTVGWSATLPNVKNPADDDTAFNGLSATLNVTDRNTQATAFSGGTDAGMVSVAGGKVYVGTGSISIVPSGTLIYELDTPVETDISEYLTGTDIEVEAGGSLTFPNQHGDDYRIPVPVKAEYIGV